MTTNENTAPEVLHADLIERAARAMFEVGGVQDGDWTWADVVREEPERAALWRNDAAQVVAALGNTVPREKFDRAWASWERTDARADRAERERDEARAERDAHAAKLTAVRKYADDRSIHHRARKDSVVGSWRIASDLLAILDTPPVTSTPLHDAEVKAQALDEAAAAMAGVPGGRTVHVPWLVDRAAVIREEAR